MSASAKNLREKSRRLNKYDRIAIVVTSENTEMKIGIPILSDGTGKEQANTVYEAGGTASVALGG